MYARKGVHAVWQTRTETTSESKKLIDKIQIPKKNFHRQPKTMQSKYETKITKTQHQDCLKNKFFNFSDIKFSLTKKNFFY